VTGRVSTTNARFNEAVGIEDITPDDGEEVDF
jgi:hypothetical protein